MMTMNDYNNFGDGFGIASQSDVENLMKALNTGNYSAANGIAGQTNGAALPVESLESSLNVLTYKEEHAKFWKDIPKKPAYSTIEEYNQLLSYGSSFSGFTGEGELPESDDSQYKRQAVFVKYLGTTRSVTHPMTLVRTAHDDVISIENQNGILHLMKQLENGLFWGNSKLAPLGQEGVQFDGLNSLIDKENTINLKGKDLESTDINYGAEMILSNFGTPNTFYLPYESWTTFNNSYFPKERVVMPTAGGGYSAGVIVNDFQSVGGAIKLKPDIFLSRTKPLSMNGSGGVKAPTTPASVTLAVASEADAAFDLSGAGTYTYTVTACNRHGESTPCTVATVALTAGDLKKGVQVTITNAASMVVEPEYFNLYRSEKDGSALYKIADIPATSVNAGGTTEYLDKNQIMPNTCTAFMGELSPQVLAFKQLSPMTKMNLATIGPSIRWMILIYGTPVLYAPKKWVKFTNIKCNSSSNLQVY